MKKYCRDIHSSLDVQFFENSITVLPCCIIRQPPQIYNNEKFQDLFTDLRTMNKSDELDDRCRKCSYFEDRNQQSKRQGSNMLFGGKEVFDLSGPEYIEITLDYTCNSACMICNEGYSSYWKRYTDSTEMTEVLSNNVGVVEDFLNNLDLSNLKKIHIKGGEPFLSNRNDMLLKYLLEHTETKNIDLMYHTNGTVYPSDYVINAFEKFRLVEIYVSIDDIELPYNYQRFPTKWEHLLKTFNQYKENMPGNVMFKIEQTISLLNAHRAYLLKEWFDASNFKTNNYTDPTYLCHHYAFGFLAPGNISKRHYEWMQEYHPKSLLNHIPVISRLTLPEKDLKIVNFINSQDKKRNMDITVWFPEFLSFYS